MGKQSLVLPYHNSFALPIVCCAKHSVFLLTHSMTNGLWLTSQDAEGDFGVKACDCRKERSRLLGSKPKISMDALNASLEALVESLKPSEEDVEQQGLAFTQVQNSTFCCIPSILHDVLENKACTFGILITTIFALWGYLVRNTRQLWSGAFQGNCLQ